MLSNFDAMLLFLAIPKVPEDSTESQPIYAILYRKTLRMNYWNTITSFSVLFQVCPFDLCLMLGTTSMVRKLFIDNLYTGLLFRYYFKVELCYVQRTHNVEPFCNFREITSCSMWNKVKIKKVICRFQIYHSLQRYKL